jgi:hypothetical protein
MPLRAWAGGLARIQQPVLRKPIHIGSHSGLFSILDTQHAFFYALFLFLFLFLALIIRRHPGR